MAVSRAEEFMTAFSQIFYRISVLVYNVFSWGHLWFSFTLGSDILKSSVSCHYSFLMTLYVHLCYITDGLGSAFEGKLFAFKASRLNIR